VRQLEQGVRNNLGGNSYGRVKMGTVTVYVKYPEMETTNKEKVS
jgi:hypothetical protein